MCVGAVVCLLSLNGGRPPALSVFLEPFGALSFHPPLPVIVLFIPAKLLPSSVCCPPAAGCSFHSPQILLHALCNHHVHRFSPVPNLRSSDSVSVIARIGFLFSLTCL